MVLKVYEYFHSDARVAQLVEYDLAKVGVAGSSPVSRLVEMKRNLDFTRFLFIFLPCFMKTGALLITDCIHFFELSRWDLFEKTKKNTKMTKNS